MTPIVYRSIDFATTVMMQAVWCMHNIAFIVDADSASDGKEVDQHQSDTVIGVKTTYLITWCVHVLECVRERERERERERTREREREREN